MYLLVGYKDVSFSHPQKNTKVDKMGQRIHSWFFSSLVPVQIAFQVSK